MTIKQKCQKSLTEVHSLSKARVYNVMYLEVRMARRDTKRNESTTMTMMSRRDGLTDMADNAEEIAACWYTPNPPPWMPCPCPRLAISNVLLIFLLLPLQLYSSCDSLFRNVRFMVHIYRTAIMPIKGGDDGVNLKLHMSKLGIMHRFIDIPMDSSPSPSISEWEIYISLLEYLLKSFANFQNSLESTADPHRCEHTSNPRRNWA